MFKNKGIGGWIVKILFRIFLFFHGKVRFKKTRLDYNPVYQGFQSLFSWILRQKIGKDYYRQRISTISRLYPLSGSLPDPANVLNHIRAHVHPSQLCQKLSMPADGKIEVFHQNPVGFYKKTVKLIPWKSNRSMQQARICLSPKVGIPPTGSNGYLSQANYLPIITK